MRTLIGRKSTSKVWHLVRHPDRGEPSGVIMSFCSLIWGVEQITFGEVTCGQCLRSINGNGMRLRPRFLRLLIGRRSA
jgi:hypothetical protein